MWWIFFVLFFLISVVSSTLLYLGILKNAESWLSNLCTNSSLNALGLYFMNYEIEL